MPTPGSFATTLYSQWFITPKLDPKLSFAGQTVIVTGSNVGLGFHAAQQIAQRGASRVILAVRSPSKGEAAAQEIRASLPKASSKSTVLEVWPLDLSSYQSVKDFGARANSELDRLDVLLESAGVAKLKFELEEDDESEIKTNVLSTTLLALLLIPKLKETAMRFGVTPRLSIVSSELAFQAKFKEWKAERIFGRDGGLADPRADMIDRYNVSKLLELIVVRQLALRISRTSSPSSSDRPLVIINSLTPGACESSLNRNVSGIFLHIILGIIGVIIPKRETAVGARVLVYAAGGAGAESHGQFLRDCRVYPHPLDVHKGKWGDAEQLSKRVWEEMMEKLEKVAPGVSKNI